MPDRTKQEWQKDQNGMCATPFDRGVPRHSHSIVEKGKRRFCRAIPFHGHASPLDSAVVS